MPYADHAKKLAHNRAYYLAHESFYKAYKRRWHQEHKEYKSERRRLFRAEHPEQEAAARVKYRVNNPEKRRAHYAVKWAIQSGKLNRVPCEVCSAVEVHAHHDDYTKLLDVRWLCRSHHWEAHNICTPPLSVLAQKAPNRG